MAGKLCVKELTVGPIGTCCYVVWREGREDCVVIDPGAEPERIRQSLEGRRIAAILLTHGHFDHIGGVEGLMGPDTDLVIHRLDAPMLKNPETNVCWMIGETITAPEATVLVREKDESAVMEKLTALTDGRLDFLELDALHYPWPEG